MQKRYNLVIKRFVFIAALFTFSQHAFSQAVYIPYSYEFNQKFNAQLYSLNTDLHTALKPFALDSALKPRYHQLMNIGVDSNRHSWLSRILFNQHLLEVNTKDYTFYGDYLPDLQIGQDVKNKVSTSMNTRGYQLGGTVGDKFFFYTSGYENQGSFPGYFENVVKAIQFVPGAAYDRNYAHTSRLEDWSYATAIVSYWPIKQLNVTLGQDKAFIGDGYRSLLLSDFAAPYPFLRVTAQLGKKVQYMAMWAYMENDTLHKFDGFGSNRRKWGVFHYIDWNITNRLSVGGFNALIAAEADSSGHFHGFDANYINPVILLSQLGPSNPTPDNVLFGGTAKYKVFDKTAIYGQFIIDRYSNTISSYTTGGYQLGIRGADLFKVRDFNYLFEYNTVKPYTYAGSQQIVAYAQYNEPLTDPLGANFKEWVAMLNYSIGRFSLQGQFNYAQYGLDASKTQDNGGDVNKPTPMVATANVTGQGISTKLYYTEGTVSFLINPKYNLRLEGNALYRMESSSLTNNKTLLFTFGLRSTFRDLYHDF
jgi:hypothetical protein